VKVTNGVRGIRNRKNDETGGGTSCERYFVRI
jgi:hypothetical protein